MTNVNQFIKNFFDSFNHIMERWQKCLENGQIEMTLDDKEESICQCFKEDVFQLFQAVHDFKCLKKI